MTNGYPAIHMYIHLTAYVHGHNELSKSTTGQLIFELGYNIILPKITLNSYPVC